MCIIGRIRYIKLTALCCLTDPFPNLQRHTHPVVDYMTIQKLVLTEFTSMAVEVRDHDELWALSWNGASQDAKHLQSI